MNVRKQNESRKDYLYRVAIDLIDQNWEAQECLVDYDDTTCDGFTLLEEMKAELESENK